MDLEQTNSYNPEGNSTNPEGNSDIQQGNIVEEMNALNHRMQNPSNGIYKISSSWDKQQNAQSNKNTEVMVREMMNYLIKMDADLTKMNTVLTNIESSLSNSKSNDKREAKAFTPFRF
ncbi:hypothetical protein MASR2M70_19100 [Bacillota bacterium]